VFGQLAGDARRLAPQVVVAELVDGGRVTPLGRDAPHHVDEGLGPEGYCQRRSLSQMNIITF
jgi:hypothetical protein